jgi:hypothetical protein
MIVMKNLAHVLILLGCAAGMVAALAQAAPPPPPQPAPYEVPRGPWRDLAPEQRERWREWHDERRQERRDAWREMSPEERHQLRRDIRDAGKFYRRGPRHD